MSSSMQVKTLRQRRALEVLLLGPVSVRGLGPIIGAYNPCQIVFELRNQGFRDIIMTKRLSVIDRDGRRCRPGEYYIPQEMKSLVVEVLTKDSTPAPTKACRSVNDTIILNVTGGGI